MINIAFCPECDEKAPINVSVMTHENVPDPLNIIYCAVCETVLNVDEDVEIEQVEDQWLFDRGWELDESRLNAANDEQWS